MDFFRENKFAIFFIAGIFIIIGGLAALIIVSFNLHNAGIHSGAISDKSHHSATHSLRCSGKPVICTNITTPESWNVTIQKDDKTNDFSVSEEEYSHLTVGENISFDGDTLEQ